MNNKFISLLNEFSIQKKCQTKIELSDPLQKSIIKHISQNGISKKMQKGIAINVSNSTLCQSPQQFAIGR